MTTLTQTSLTISGVMPIWNPFKANWPNPEASICELYTWHFPVKNKRCWSIQGRAREVYGPIREAIKRCVEERGQDLFEGANESCVPHSVNCLMVGSSKARARPYIVISCRQHEVSKRLMVWIKDTQEWRELTDHNPGFGGFLLLHDVPIRMADARVEVGSSLVYSSTDYTDINGAPIFFSTTLLKSYDKCPAHQARAGNIIYLDGVPFGLTVAHPLAEQKYDRPLGQYSPESGPVIYMDNDDDDCCSITSELSSPAGSNLLQTLHSTPFTGSVTPKALSGQPNLVGRLVCSSPGTPDDIADWALFALSPKYLSNAPELPLKISDQIMPSEQRHDRPLPTRRKGHRATAQEILRDRSGHPSAKRTSAAKSSDDDPRAVFTREGDKAIRLGVLDENESLVWLAGGHEYMSLQTVIMEKKVCPGDCGVWAFNRDGSWLGHLVAGMTDSNTAYLAQASDILLDIQRKTGATASPLLDSHSRMCVEFMQSYDFVRTSQAQSAYIAALLAASAFRNDMVVQLLIKSEANLTAHYRAVLQAAAESDDERLIQLLIKSEANLTAHYRAVLQAAAESDDERLIQLLIKSEANLNAHYSAVLYAVSKRGDEGPLQLLVKAVADVDAHHGLALKRAASEENYEKMSALLERFEARFDAYYGSALQAASAQGNEESVRLLIDSGANLSAWYGDVLLAASERGVEKVIELLISSRAIVIEFHEDAIEAASERGFTNIVQMLLRSTVDFNASYDHALRSASKQGHEKIVKLLINSGVDCSADHGAALRIASGRGFTKVVQLLLRSMADIEVDHGDALQSSSEQKNRRVIQALVDIGADIISHYDNALLAASESGHNEIAQLLIMSGANVNFQNGSVLLAASKNCHTKIVELLISSGVDLDAQYGAALMSASERGHKKVVLLLLGAGADVNGQRISDGKTLHKPSVAGYEMILRRLSSAGARFDDDYGAELLKASERGHEKVVKLLLIAEATSYKHRPEHGKALYAASERGYDKVVQVLLERAHLNTQELECSNALYVASSEGHEKVVQLLLAVGADANTPRREYGSALHAALTRDHESVVMQLISSGADVNAQGAGLLNDTALNKASRWGNEKLVQYLLDAGADIHAQGAKGNALHIACEHNREDIVRLLIDAGADVHARRGRRTTALDIASQLGYEKIVQLLLNAGAGKAPQ